jgi:ribosomal protein L32E
MRKHVTRLMAQPAVAGLTSVRLQKKSLYDTSVSGFHTPMTTYGWVPVGYGTVMVHGSIVS